jgi:hypothetical protein
MNNFPHLRRISQAKWIVVRELILLWTLSNSIPDNYGKLVENWGKSYGVMMPAARGTYCQ